MGADQIAEIRPAIAELEADEHHDPDDAPRFFAVFSLAGRDSPWVEIYLDDDETIANLWYTIDAEPLAHLTRRGVALPPGARVVNTAKGLACTLAFDRCSSYDVACFVDRLFLNVFGCEEDYALDVELCRFTQPGRRPH
jgi:hypothetical protein